MDKDRRCDRARAHVFETALRINAVLGPTNAWCHLRLRDIGPAIALRAIACDGARRQSDNEMIREAEMHKHVHWQAECETMVDTPHGEQRRRRDTITAQVADRAVELLMHGARHDAEELLAEYGMTASTVLRLMLEPDRRRPVRWY